MRLKELTVQGYKSFATKTRFEFPPGVTAIVGPNGSGKSNIADAIRWVLGEQRTSHLRARKTDDMIFAGSQRRSRSGLAEVHLVLDNSDSWLDVDFTEVAVGRRAHRDGVNEYFLNGARVRLRDVLDLLGARLGQSTYTVIGQGLVDSALSLRPEERRGLIDEAAGILPLQRRRDRAVRQLEETRVNLTRVRDVLAELGPRLKRMTRLSERAQRHEDLAAEIGAALAMSYGYRWRRALERLEASRARALDLSRTVARIQHEIADLEGQFAEAEAKADANLKALKVARGRRDAVQRDLAAASEAAAVAQARLEGLAARRAEREAAAEARGRERERLARAADEARLALEAQSEAYAALVREKEVAEKALAAAEDEASSWARAVADLRREAVTAESRAAAVESSLNAMAAGDPPPGQDRATRAADIENLEQAASGAAAATAEADAAFAAAVKETSDAAAELEAVAGELRATEADLQRRQRELASAGAELARLEARSQALDAKFAAEERPDTARGRVTAAAGDSCLGPVTQVLEVETGWEAAAAAALGGLADGLVMRSAAAVETALRRVAGPVEGRVALVPGDGDHDGSSWTAAKGERRAQDLVACAAAPAAVSRLLADCAFVDDMAAARQAVGRRGGPLRAATRAGQLLMRSGVVVLGAPARRLLDLEAERRAMPARLDAARKAEAAVRAAVEELREDCDSLAARRAAAAARCLEADADRRRAAEALEAARAKAARAQRELDWAEEAADRARVKDSQDTVAREGLAAEKRQLAARAASLHAKADALEAEADRWALDAARQRAADAARVLAEAASSLAAARTSADLAAATAARAQELEIAAGSDDDLAAEAEALGSVAADMASRAGELTDELASAEADLAPAEEAAAALAAGLRELARDLEAARRDLHAAEARQTDARLAAARAEGRVERLYEQLLADAEWLPAARSLPPDLDLEALPRLDLPEVRELDDSLAERIPRLRRQLRSIGGIDSEALAAFRETRERYDHLVEQRADLEAAEADVIQVLDTLEEEMGSRFAATFESVAAAFAVTFPILFGGGEARLRMDEETSGVDIVARPPGKRPQPLALLSGGERALTAVALVFALLKASETPFVVLDEVDAALDEANVDRFRRALEDLATSTQVVIITHNRGTVQTANTVYGISMAEDGASQSLSLRVEDLA